MPILRMIKVPARAEAIYRLLYAAPLKGRAVAQSKRFRTTNVDTRRLVRSGHSGPPATAGTPPGPKENGPSVGAENELGPFKSGRHRGGCKWPAVLYVRSDARPPKGQRLHDQSHWRDDRMPAQGLAHRPSRRGPILRLRQEDHFCKTENDAPKRHNEAIARYRRPFLRPFPRKVIPCEGDQRRCH
jgi:hypothetical protein